MASFLHADLPSEDEEDDSYDPDKDQPGAPAKRKAAGSGPSRRGRAAGAPAQQAPNVQIVCALDQKRKDKVAALFDQLKSTADAKQGGRAPPPQTPARAQAGTSPARPITLPQPIKRKAANQDLVWMRSLGLAPAAKRSRAVGELVSEVLFASTTRLVVEPAGPGAPARAPLQRVAALDAAQPTETPSDRDCRVAAAQQGEPGGVFAGVGEAVAAGDAVAEAGDQRGGSAGAAAAAAAAVAALASGAHRADAAQRAGMVTVVETRRFAGQDVEIKREVKVGSKQAENVQQRAAAAAASTGLDAVLHNISGPRKANVMDKTADDWKGFKQTNTDVQDELHEHQKSSNKYLEKQAFLKQAELNEYERQRDARLGSDIRNRGRL